MSARAQIDSRVLDIAFRSAFRHASAARSRMQSVWVAVRMPCGATGLGEGCPREYVTGEDPRSALAFIERYRRVWGAELDGPAALDDWAMRHAGEIDANPAAWCAVELAFLDAFARRAGVPVEAMLGFPVARTTFRYTAVLGDDEQAGFVARLKAYRRTGFGDFKVKLSGERDRDQAKMRALRDEGIDPARVRADANNLWRDVAAAQAHIASLDFAFAALEEPLGAGDFDGMRRLSDASGSPVILDESVLRSAQLEALSTDAERWIVNVRLSKMGGLVRAAALVARARALGLGVVIGVHVGETSILTRAALPLAVLAGGALRGHEGAFGTHLLAHDPAAPCLMFGPGGTLDFDPAAFGPGWGLHETGDSLLIA